MAEAGTFHALRLVRREWESTLGCSDVCRGEDGEGVVRLRLRDERCQRDFLSAGEAWGAPMLLERGVLEVLYPCPEGVSLKRWLYEQRPGLGLRRDVCLSLLAHCAGTPTAPGVLVLSARVENLRFSQRDAWLLYLPDWSGWRTGFRGADAVGAAAGLCREILTGGMSRWERRRWPDELRLVCLRVQEGGYRDWSELSRDLTCLPEGLKSLGEARDYLLDALERKTRRLRRPALYALTCALVLAALLSLISVFRAWQNERRSIWPGMTPIGDQEMRDS